MRKVIDFPTAKVACEIEVGTPSEPVTVSLSAGAARLTAVLNWEEAHRLTAGLSGALTAAYVAWSRAQERAQAQAEKGGGS